jgi:type II secretory pathway pseudopilin PulG
MGSLRGLDSLPKGSTLIGVLLTMTVILILGMAFLSQKSSQYESAVRGREALQAEMLAQAGIVDFRKKIAKDRSFPPKRPEGTERYEYTEVLTDLNDAPYGAYKITVDLSRNVSPYWIAQVTSVGYLGSADKPVAQSSIYAELDMAKDDRENPGVPNPRYREWVVFQEGSGPTNPSP